MGGFEVVRSSDPNTLVLSGELDMATVPVLEAALAEALTAKGELTLDMRGVTFVDSRGVRAFIAASSQRGGTGPLRLIDVHEHVRRVFEIMGVEECDGLVIVPQD